jgi:AAA domain-containing protein
MTLRTRKPSGKMAPPVILLEGGEGAGKSWAAAALSGSDKVGRTFWLQVGTEVTADEYGAIPGVRYEIVEHDGTWRQIFGAVLDAKTEAEQERKRGAKPTVLVIDTVGALWEMLSDWAYNRAKGSKKNKAKLEEDPNAEIDVTTNFWNDATGRWRKLMTTVLTFPGIVVLLSRGRETVLMQNGQPVMGKTDYKVEGQKGLTFDVPVWVRMTRDMGPHAARVMKLRSVHNPVEAPKPGAQTRNPGKVLPDFTLERLVFDFLKFSAEDSEERVVVPMQPGSDAPLSEMAAVLELAVTSAEDVNKQLRAAYSRVKAAAESGDVSPAEAAYLGDLVSRRKVELESMATPQAPEPVEAAA